MERSSGPTPRRFLYLALVVVFLIGLEIASYLAIGVLNPRLDEPIVRRARIYAEQSRLIQDFLSTHGTKRELLDSVLGWVYRPGFEIPGDRVTAQGLRGDRIYADTAPAGVLRIAAFGDSYVYGSEVDFGDAWPSLAEDLHPDLEIPNYGVGGYGTDQAYLRYQREGQTLAPHVVVIGFAPVDLRRAVNVYRRFISVHEGLAVKPRFVRKADGSLELVESPIARPSQWADFLDDPGRITEFGRFDQWYEPAIYRNPLYDLSATVRLTTAVWIRIRRRLFDPDRIVRGGQLNPQSEAFAVQMELFNRFVDEVAADGSEPMIVFLPDRMSVTSARDGAPSTYAPLVDAVRAAGLPYLDALAAFPPEATDDIAGWFMPGGHYSPAANRLVGSWLGGRLAALGTAGS